MLIQETHAVLPQATQDEAARQQFVYSLGNYIQNEVNPGLKGIYEQRARPAFVAEHDREPRDRHEVRKQMVKEVYYQLASSMQRTTQEMLWNSVDETVARQLDELVEQAERIRSAPRWGSLSLDAGFEMPGYIANVDNHAMPGGYSADLGEGDVASGALYDRGAFIYTQGLFGPRMDGIGRAAVNFVRSRFADLEPRRILDMGCTIGASTVALHDAWPEAETHGIDVGAPLLRYAHSRAESWEKPVHFSQQNAEHTSFEATGFDLVTCLATLHETSRTALRNIFAEAHRLLRPGGLFLIAEIPPYTDESTPFELFARDWDTLNNNEPFWGAMHETDLAAVMAKAGFPAAGIIETFARGIAAANNLVAEVAVDNKKFVGATRGGGDSWYAAARKGD